MINKLILLLAILSFSSSFSQQVYGVQRGQRGYIPPPKFEASVYVTTIDAYKELEKTLLNQFRHYFYYLTYLYFIKWYPEPDLNRHAIASEGF